MKTEGVQLSRKPRSKFRLDRVIEVALLSYDMSIILPLSTLPAERLKARADSGLFPWGDPDAAKPLIEEACEGSGGDPEREAELILLALRENVPTAIRRALDRNPDVRMERCLRQVAEYYGNLPHIASRANPAEARWSVDTLAAMAGLIPSSEVGATAAMPKAPPRPTPVSPPPPSPLPTTGASSSLTGASPPPAWAATQPVSSLPPWVQAPSGAAAPSAPAASNATTSLPAPPGTGIAAGMGVASERGGTAPGAWPPTPSSGGAIGGRASFGAGQSDYGDLPPEVAQNKWSWAGFLSGVFWMCSHRLVYPALIWLALFLISFVAKPIGNSVASIGHLCLAIYLGVNGNRLAWTHRQFDSVEQFRAVQKIWVRVDLAFIVLGVLGALIFGAVLFPVFMHAYNAAHHGAPVSP